MAIDKMLVRNENGYRIVTGASVSSDIVEKVLDIVDEAKIPWILRKDVLVDYKNGSLFVALDPLNEERVVGFCTSFRAGYKTCTIKRLYVVPVVRRHGVASALVRAVFEKNRTFKLSYLVTPHKDSIGTQIFFVSLGFKDTHEFNEKGYKIFIKEDDDDLKDETCDNAVTAPEVVASGT